MPIATAEAKRAQRKTIAARLSCALLAPLAFDRFFSEVTGRKRAKDARLPDTAIRVRTPQREAASPSL
jgi:hypothetical protein